ncbi:3-oxoacyl-ACP synthase III family protein [Micromonospora yangpuensis]|uniref:3-oxoacyl-[acyl-carrier-protein] synthase-3 n=1 Tax=Micromonospora yangpuensis TaxID=683228 RepID=A0A1C6UFB9_9ACTN|nr:3-oxoacyl-[acyl-carrier-protein] synthase III C-terminal domain-containing protein [Micromonospora yangpuensis]GGM05910.1 3-oxoacyl-ACP synthase [Micromonospora yangpuensis]SCL52641.1 3-oxoacyl-[acyl-carrier-protein] synthase-3 [Micromonospora yangpuensis]
MESAAATTVQAVQTYAPERSVTVEEVAGGLGLNRHQTRLFRRVHGQRLLREDPELPLLDLITPAARAVLRDVDDPDRIRYLIFAHTIQSVAPSYLDVAMLAARELGLRRAAAFALTQQNCATGLAAVDVAGELLRADDEPGALALVLTGEKTFSRIAQLVENTSIMGEAAAACLVGLAGAGLRVRSYVVRTYGQHADIFRPSPASRTEFSDTYVPRLVEVIHECLAEAGVAMADIELIVPHNVNVSSWLRALPDLGIDRKQVYLDNVERYGHCFCSDPFVNLATLRAEQRLIPGGRYLLTSVGLGATYAAMVVENS